MAVPVMAAPPRQASDPATIPDSRCVACHADVDRAWRGSHHARAMQPATAQTILGDFAGREVADGGETVFLYRAKDAFYARARGAGRSLRSHRILYTLGVDPLQQYVVEAPNGRLQILTVAWDVRQRRWFSLAGGNAAAFDTAMHWSGRYYNWNLMCAECHSTGVRKHYDPKTDSYSTTWTALQVGCQACHGPGRAHAEAARRGRRQPLPVDFRGDAASEIDQCARCHTVRSRITQADEAGTPLLDHFRPETLRAGLYYPDGQQQGEVFEVGSFRQSRMHQAGVRCTDCHDPHGGKLKRPGNPTCTACHSEAANQRFPGLALRRYDDLSHHFHAAGGPGSRCVDCHMPAQTYMGVHSRRDHAFRIPRPDLSEGLGVPNACNNCHADRGSRWAADFLAARYGERKPAIHFGEIFARARRGDAKSAPSLAAIASNQEQPAIVRATAVDLLGSMQADVPPKTFADPDPIVRASAAAALAGGGGAAAPLLSMLTDPIRAVRIAAARSLGALGRESVPVDHREPFARVLDEYRNSQLAMADAPAARLNLASLARDQGDLGEAEDHYRAALAMDPQLDKARTELAPLLVERGEEVAATALLRQGIVSSPAPANLEFALGLLFGGAGRFLEADAAFTAALEHRPDASRVRYNHALVLMRLERWNDAEAALNAVLANAPANADALYALATLHARTGRIDSARNIARDLLGAHPEDSRFQSLADWLW